MSRLILILAVVAGLWWLISVRSRPRGDRAAPPVSPPDAPADPSPQARSLPDTMVVCAHCGVHLPRSEAVVGEGGALFCSAAHAQAGARAPGSPP